MNPVIITKIDKIMTLTGTESIPIITIRGQTVYKIIENRIRIETGIVIKEDDQIEK